MGLDTNKEAASIDVAGAVAERPGCVTAYAILLLAGGVAGVLLPFYYALGPRSPKLTPQGLVVLTILSMAHAAVSIPAALGLWRVQRWGVGLVMALASYGLARGIHGSVVAAAADSVDSAVIEAGVSAMLFLIVVYWFVSKRALFKPSPSLDRWIVGAGALVLAVVLVTEIIWR